MNVRELFEQLGALMYDQPDAAEMPVKIEMLIDSGLAQEDVSHIRQEQQHVGTQPRALIVSGDTK